MDRWSLIDPECGSWICGTPRDGVVRVPGGTLDDTSGLRPTRHIWARRKQPWVVLPEGDEVLRDRLPDRNGPFTTALVRVYRATEAGALYATTVFLIGFI